jgi:hypothetical protein
MYSSKKLLLYPIAHNIKIIVGNRQRMRLFIRFIMLNTMP